MGKIFATVSLLGIASALALPCATVSKSSMSTLREDVAIVWDHESKIEHFIREVQFMGKEPDFGFLVPTPTEPEIAEADRKCFGEIFRALVIGGVVPRGSASFGGTGGGVKVVKTVNTGNYIATVLRADEGSTLQKWLSENQYPSRVELIPWVDIYLKKKWYITAFKIANGGKEGTKLNPVRLSFSTEAPIYPYREPIEPHPDLPRLLRVYLFSKVPLQPLYRERGDKWIAKHYVAYQMPDATWTPIAKLLALPENLQSSAPFLNVYDDETQTCPNDDLVFKPINANANMRDSKFLSRLLGD